MRKHPYNFNCDDTARASKTSLLHFSSKHNTTIFIQPPPNSNHAGLYSGHYELLHLLSAMSLTTHSASLFLVMWSLKHFSSPFLYRVVAKNSVPSAHVLNMTSLKYFSSPLLRTIRWPFSITSLLKYCYHIFSELSGRQNILHHFFSLTMWLQPTSSNRSFTFNSVLTVRFI